MSENRTEKFRKRFTKYYPILCKIAYGYIPNKDECEDIVQEAFISIWNKQKDLLPEKNFISYMTVSVKNNCISYMRKQKDENISLDDSPQVQSMVYDLPDDTDEEEAPPEEKLEQVLLILPPKCKEVFLMSKLRGMKYREIATELNISEKTVENQMGKAIKYLREFVANNSLLILALILIFINSKLK